MGPTGHQQKHVHSELVIADGPHKLVTSVATAVSYSSKHSQTQQVLDRELLLSELFYMYRRTEQIALWLYFMSCG